MCEVLQLPGPAQVQVRLAGRRSGRRPGQLVRLEEVLPEAPGQEECQENKEQKSGLGCQEETIGK